MTESNFNCIQGRNIRRLRTSQGLTLTQLAERVSQLADEDVSANLLGCWERGTRTISSEWIMYLSQALHCPYSQLYTGADYRLTVNSQVEQMMSEFAALPEDAKQTLLSVAQAFDGDKLALIKYIQLCHFDLPREYRREVIAMGLHQREIAEIAGKAEPKPEDVAEVTEVWRRMYHRRKE